LKHDIVNIRKFITEHPQKVYDCNNRLIDLNNQLERFEKDLAVYLAKKEELNEFAETIEQDAKELNSKEILIILKSDYNSRIQNLQKLAQDILESALFEKNEVYFHKVATQEDKDRSIQTLDGIKTNYRYILSSIIKAHLKL